MRVGYQPVGHGTVRPIVRRVLFFAVVWGILIGGSRDQKASTWR